MAVELDHRPWPKRRSGALSSHLLPATRTVKEAPSVKETFSVARHFLDFLNKVPKLKTISPDAELLRFKTPRSLEAASASISRCGCSQRQAEEAGKVH